MHKCRFFSPLDNAMTSRPPGIHLCMTFKGQTLIFTSLKCRPTAKPNVDRGGEDGNFSKAWLYWAVCKIIMKGKKIEKSLFFTMYLHIFPCCRTIKEKTVFQSSYTLALVGIAPISIFAPNLANHIRYLFWLVYYLNFWKLIKTNNVIGKIWHKNWNWGNSN